MELGSQLQARHRSLFHYHLWLVVPTLLTSYLAIRPKYDKQLRPNQDTQHICTCHFVRSYLPCHGGQQGSKGRNSIQCTSCKIQMDCSKSCARTYMFCLVAKHTFSNNDKAHIVQSE